VWFARTLYDVDGNVLIDRHGTPLNLKRPEIDTAFENGDIRMIRNSTTKNICYRYFVTSEEQRRQFLFDRENGSLFCDHVYSVYLDEDVDKSTSEYKSLFVN
jgi:hypothetical protein